MVFTLLYFLKKTNLRNTINVLILYFFKLLKYLPIYLLKLTFPNSLTQLIKRFYIFFSFIAVISHIFFYSFSIIIWHIFISNTFAIFLVVFLYRFGNTFLLLIFLFSILENKFLLYYGTKKNFLQRGKKPYTKQLFREERKLKQFVYIWPKIFFIWLTSRFMKMW